jgi:cation diffusion facilitator family transporter
MEIALMGKNSSPIKDSQVIKYLKWHILRFLRLNSQTQEELVEKISKLYLGYWRINSELITRNLSHLAKEGWITYEGKYLITKKGLAVLEKKEREIEKSGQKLADKEVCARYSLFGNAGLSGLEFIVGFLSGSISLIADAVHTAIDILVSAITWIGIRIKKEGQSAFIGGIILCGIGFFIAYESINKIFKSHEIHFQVFALITIMLNIAVNSFFSFYKFYVGGRTRSISLVADAYHTKTDVWSSVAVLVGLVGATLGFSILDAIAGAVVSVFIMHGGAEHLLESFKVMRGQDPKLEKFSKFLEGHLKVLPERGALVSLWYLNLQDMTEKENLEHLKKSIGRKFPVSLKNSDYDTIFDKLRNDLLAESFQGKLRLTEKGRNELKNLAQKRVTFIPWLQSKLISPRKIKWWAQSL